MVNLCRRFLNVSEQQADQTSGESGSLGAGPAISPSSQAQDELVAAAALASVRESAHIESPALVPEQAPAAEPAEADARRTPGKVMIMSAADRPGPKDDDAGPKPEAAPSAGMSGKRRLAALAAVVALATTAGALGGRLATAGFGHFFGDHAASAGNRTFEATVARIDADILNLRLSLEHTSKMGMSQFNRTSDRLDKIEKAQAEPAAKLAKLSEAVDKLRAAPPVAPVSAAAAQVAAKEVTGSIASAPPAADAAKAEVGRLPTLEGWVLRGVSHGIALIEGRRGIYEVYAGDPVPGAGRVEAIRRQDGRWVVVTSKGLILGR